jgi:hypothetical protein
MRTRTDLFVWGMLAHLVGDWLLQNHWMAQNKANLRHRAAWTHSGIQAALLALVFPWPFALLIGVIHALIDTRWPLYRWQEVFKQTTLAKGEAGWHVLFWGDQTLHLLTLGIAALLTGRKQ